MIGRGRKRTWRFRLNEDTVLEVSAPQGATEKQVRRRGRVSLVLMTLAAAAILVGVAGGAVWTDQSDYTPGSVVTISGDNSNGAGYVPGNEVAVAVIGPVSAAYPEGWTSSCSAVVGDDDLNSWSCEITLDSSEDVAVGSYAYTATSTNADGDPISESGTFTDAPTTGATFVASGISPATVDYSDIVTFTGTFTCTDNGSQSQNLCAASYTSISVAVQLKGGALADWTPVETETKSASFSTPCSSACSDSWSVDWQAGRIAGTSVLAPGTYDVRVVITGFGGTKNLPANGLDDALTLTKEDTTTTYNGDTTGGTNTPLPVSALVEDFDKGSGAGNGVFSPDDYLAGTAVVDFTLYSNSAMTTAVGTDSPDTNILNTGATTGSPTVTLPATPGTYYMKTTYAGNTYYFGSYDGPDNIVVTSTEIQVCKAAPAIAADYLKQQSQKKKIRNQENIVQLIADEMAKLTRAQFPTYTSATSPGSEPLLRPCPNQAAYKTSVEYKTQYWITTLR